MLPLQKSKDLTEGGCECISAVGKDVTLTPFDAFFVTMSIARDYSEDLEAIKHTSNISKIADGMMENIGKLLVILQQPLEKFDVDPTQEIVKKYGLIDTAAEIRGSNRNLDSVMKCYRTVLSIDTGITEEFFAKLYNGFEISGALLRDDDKDLTNDPRWNDLREIIDQIPHYELSTVELNYTPEEFGAFLEDFKRFYQEFYPEDESALAYEAADASSVNSTAP